MYIYKNELILQMLEEIVLLTLLHGASITPDINPMYSVRIASPCDSKVGSI